MMYNDFQILNNDEYNLINEQYSHHQASTQTDIINNLFLQLDECKSFCFGLNKYVNKRIQNALVFAKNELDKLIYNINVSYKVSVHSIQAVTNFNIFAFAKKLMEGLELVQKLLEFATDPNTINFVKGTATTITSIAEQLFDALENSNIHLFKFM